MRYLLVLLCAFASNQALAFGELGHKMVCDMAYKLLSPSTSKKVDELMAHHKALNASSHFGLACSWPDEVRALPTYKHTSVWHYVNIKRNDNEVTSQHCPKEGCVLFAIDAQLEKLSPYAPSPKQLEALLFAGHFIGDLHQPLHAGYAEDLGGNRTAVYVNGKPSNLHGVWDYVMLEHTKYEQSSKQTSLYLDLLNKQKMWQSTSVLDWANESVLLVKLIYQGYKPGMLVDERYSAEHIHHLEQRLQQAAVRLAYRLEKIWDDASDSTNAHPEHTEHHKH